LKVFDREDAPSNLCI